MTRISELLSGSEVKFLNALVAKENEKELSKPKKKRIRVHEIAAEYGIDSKKALAVLKDIGEFVKGPLSQLVFPVARKLRSALEERGLHRISQDELTNPTATNEVSVFSKSKPSAPIFGKTKRTNVRPVKPEDKTRAVRIKPQMYVFDRRRLDSRVSQFNRDPTAKKQALVVSEFKKLYVTVSRRVSDIVEKRNLLGKLQAEYLEFIAPTSPAQESGSLISRDVPGLGEKALKPFRGLANRTPDGPLSETFWDNPVQDR